MVLSCTARPGKPPEPLWLMPRPWSVRSQPLSKGDVSLCFKMLHHGGLQPQGNPPARSALCRNWGFFQSSQLSHIGENMSPLFCLLHGPAWAAAVPSRSKYQQDPSPGPGNAAGSFAYITNIF